MNEHDRESSPGLFAGASRRYWLMKSEPSEVSIDDLCRAPGQRTGWFGVRNYQARNYMRDTMQPGDLAFFYHSSCPEPGIAGIVRVACAAYPDPTQFDPGSSYYDPKSTVQNPRWQQVDVELVRKVPLLGLQRIRECPELQGMRILQKGNRLSITPVTLDEWMVLEGMLALNDSCGAPQTGDSPQKS